MGKRLLTVLLLIFFIPTLTACFGTIETGHVGVRTNFNKTIETEELNPGFYVAVLTSVDEYVTKETELLISGLTPKANDNLTLENLDISIFYTVNGSQVADTLIKYSGMSVNVPDSWSKKYPNYKLVERISKGAIFDTVAQHESLTMHTKRQLIETEIMNRVQGDLNDSDPGVFNITKVVIQDARTDPALEKSIQDAVQMQKQVEAKRNELELAKAEAARKKAEADGVAAANEALDKSLTPNLIKWREMEMLEKFAQEGTHTVLLGTDGASPLINVR